MTENPMRGSAALTRRLIVQAAIGTAAGIAADWRPAAAAPTISKAAVAYQDRPEGDKECDKCVQFVAPSSCKIVEGTISPHGSCRIFQPARQTG